MALKLKLDSRKQRKRKAVQVEAALYERDWSGRRYPRLPMQEEVELEDRSVDSDHPARLPMQKDRCRRCGGDISRTQKFINPEVCSHCDAKLDLDDLKTWTAGCCILATAAVAGVVWWMFRF